MSAPAIPIPYGSLSAVTPASSSVTAATSNSPNSLSVSASSKVLPFTVSHIHPTQLTLRASATTVTLAPPTSLAVGFSAMQQMVVLPSSMVSMQPSAPSSDNDADDDHGNRSPSLQHDSKKVKLSANDPMNAQFTTKSKECSICLEAFASSDSVPIELEECGHEFHGECIVSCLQHDAKCPICRCCVGSKPYGKCPSGTMSIHCTQSACPGFAPTVSAIQIDYSIPSGIQSTFHDSPGQHFSGAHRTAFLPNNSVGFELLQRLKYAFLHGYTFQVGTSLTSGQTDVVTWTSIHHKTSLNGSAHGFPDWSYISNCHEALDALNVPPFTNTNLPQSQSSPSCDIVTNEIVQYIAPQTSNTDNFIKSLLLLDGSNGTYDANNHSSAVSSSSSIAAAVPMPPPLSINAFTPVIPIPPPSVALTASPPLYIEGESPSGSMSVTLNHTINCSGYVAGTSTIVIEYSIPSGPQQEVYHPHPGQSYTGTRRLAYLPNTTAGQELLSRLKYAFVHGHCFDIGYSVVQRRDDVVRWSERVGHITCVTGGGPFGYPNPNYITKTNAQLDALHIPPWHLCP